MNQDRAANLLASGIPPSQVASIMGVTPARISQLLKEESFALSLAAREAEIASGDIEEITLAAKYHAAESALIQQVMEMAPMAELRDVTAALRVVGERRIAKEQSRNPLPIGGSTIINNIVQLSLPSHALPEIAITKQKEIISIGDKNLAPMTSTGITNLFKKIGNEYELPRIPQSTAETLTETPSTTEEAEFLEVIKA